jgi:hypothetical protein
MHKKPFGLQPKGFSFYLLFSTLAAVRLPVYRKVKYYHLKGIAR